MASSAGPRKLLQNRFSRRAGLRAGTLGAVGASAWLIACGGGGDDDSAGTGAGTSGAAGTQGAPAPTGDPVRGGTVAYRISGTPPLDPHTNTTFRAQNQAAFTYSRLLKFKTGLDPAVSFNYEVEPDLAQSVEMIGDGTQITFKLQPNATFHNKPPVNGRAATSEDVRVSLERFRTSPQNTNRNAFGYEQNPIVTAVETPDPQTVVVRLAKPYAPIQNLFANPQYLWILPQEVMSGFDPSRDQIGTGPFVLNQLQPDIAAEMSRNPNYFNRDLPYIQNMRAVIIPEVAQEIAQFQAERLDVAAVPAENKSDVERSNPRAAWISYLPTTYTFISPQQREGSPFRDERLRRALSMGIDREAWGDLLYLSQGVKVQNFVPASMGKWWLDPTGNNAGDGAKWFQSNPREARQLIQAAGFEGQQLRFIFTNNAYGERFNQGAEATAGMLNQAGFNTQIVIQDYLREYIAAGQTFFGNYQGVFYGLQTPFTDPHDYLFNMMSSGSARNHAGINDPRLEEMLRDEERTLDEDERVRKVQEIQRYAMDRMYYIPIAVGNAYIALQPWTKNYQYSATYGAGTETYAKVWVDRG
jgi:peptide/nickel transport system substrate-binding protein